MSWFLAALAVLAVSQIARLHQIDPAAWLVCDYAGRIGALIVLAIVPSARRVAFARRPGKLAWWRLSLWIVGFVLFDRLLWRGLGDFLPKGAIAGMPPPAGWLRVFDLTFGLVLVAYSEEIVFRRCARHVVADGLGDGAAMVIVTSILFAAYHWWTGIGNIVVVGIVGVYAMIFYQRSEAIWPVVVGHYLTDLVVFA